MKKMTFNSKEDLLAYAQRIIGTPIGEIDSTGRINKGKGSIGQIIEESWFGYKPNSNPEPDFPEVGVELKVTPYKKTKRGYTAKERLVCNIINYMEEYKHTFYDSDFWHKCQLLLIMSYEHIEDIPKAEFTIDKAILFSFPVADLEIIKQDWEAIVQKIKEGKAHELSEGDTSYLGACTKGTTAKSVRQQPFSDIPAKQRAYSLKQSYMTYVLNSFILGNKVDEHIIRNPDELKTTSFTEIITRQIEPFYGRTQQSLIEQFQINAKAKNVNELILASIFGIRGRISETEEFKKANIIPKTIRIQNNGRIKESMSFPAFKFCDIITETWDDSTLKNYLEPTKFMFVIFRENETGALFLERIKFWNIPVHDLEEVHTVWERTVQVIRDGVKTWFDGKRNRNNFPKSVDNPVCHVRPHAKNASDTYPLPDGRRYPKQCFWFNSNYVKSIIQE